MANGNPRLRYHCVSIVPGDSGCEAARSIADQRLLSADAPRLPLPNCSRPAECECTYRHYDDRRSTQRRAHDRGDSAAPWTAAERRRPGGRRVTDV